MAESPGTLEGWFALHDFRRIKWPEWKSLAEDERNRAVAEAIDYIQAVEKADDCGEGNSASYAVVGHKGDLLFLHLRPTVNQLLKVENAFNRTRLADFTEQTYSYLSVTELSLYEASARGGTDDPAEMLKLPFVEQRLKPTIPDYPCVSFYPMNKRRGDTWNWFTESMGERRRMMREHGATGRKFRDSIKQMITGSTGLDDWEWGITLFATDALSIKKLVYEMRFDEVSAKFGEFGPFRLGLRLTPEGLKEMLTV